MDSDRDLNIWALASSCQRLAEKAHEISRTRRSVDQSTFQEVGRLVVRATDLLEGRSEPRPALPANKGKLGGLLGRVLGGAEGDSSEQPIGDRPPSPKHMLSLRGQEQLIPTPDLVHFMSSQRKTGLLEVVTATEIFVLEFENGDIVHAQSNRTPAGQRLGDVLVSQRVIERQALEQVLKTTATGRLGETLVSIGLITKEQFLDALRLQIHWLFQRLFEQPSTRFSFWSGPPLYAESSVRLNATALLLDGARAFDETQTAIQRSAEAQKKDGEVGPGGTDVDWLDIAGSS